MSRFVSFNVYSLTCICLNPFPSEAETYSLDHWFPSGTHWLKWSLITTWISFFTLLLPSQGFKQHEGYLHRDVFKNSNYDIETHNSDSYYYLWNERPISQLAHLSCCRKECDGEAQSASSKMKLLLKRERVRRSFWLRDLFSARELCLCSRHTLININEVILLLPLRRSNRLFNYLIFIYQHIMQRNFLVKKLWHFEIYYLFI